MVGVCPKRKGRHLQRDMEKIDVVSSMNLTQRLDHLISGYFRMCIDDNKHETKLIFLANDITLLCSNFTGITENSYYHLIISDTELREQQKRMKIIKKALMTDSKQTAQAYKQYYGGYNYEKTIINLRIFIHGPINVGKSNLIIRYITNEFAGDDYVPSNVGDEWRKWISIDSIKFYYQIEEINCYQGFDAMKNMKLRQMDCGLFVYDITNRESFDELESMIEDVQRIWIESVDDNDDEQEFKFAIIVGNKCDLENERVITKQEGNELAQRYDNLVFLETSAQERINVEKVFEDCSKLRMIYKLLNDTDYFKNKQKHSCCILL